MRWPVRRTGDTDSVVGQLNRDLTELDVRKEVEREEFARIKSELDASHLLARLSHSHGLTPEKYQVLKGSDGSDRIKAGSRKLNVSDFLTKELHLPWKEASEILREAYAEQLGQEHEPQVRNTPRRELWESWRKSQPERTQKKSAEWNRQRESEAERRSGIRSVYQAKRRSIYSDKALKPAQRKAALSVAQMDRVGQDIELRAAIAAERVLLKGKHARPRTELYKVFLQELANQGDEGALDELRRQRSRAPLDVAANSIECADDSTTKKKLAHIFRDMRYTVDRNGNVTYYADMTNRRALVVDHGRRVKVEAPQDRDAVEIGLRLALQKFGPNLDVQGSDEFKAQLIEAALRNNLRVEFADPKMKTELKRHRVERDELSARGRAFIDQVGMGNVEKPREKRPEQEKQLEKGPKRSDLER